MKYPVQQAAIGVMTLGKLLERSVSLYGDKLALRKKVSDTWSSYTYTELYDAVVKVARFLRENGLKKGDLIGIISENRPEWIIAYFAIHWIGGVAVPLDSRAKPSEILHIVRHSGMKAVFASCRYLDVFAEVDTGKKSVLRYIICLDKREDFQNFPDIMNRYTAGGKMEEVSLADLAVVLYTSGTTGNSKAVMLSHRNIVSNVNSLVQCVEFDSNDRFFSILPIHHVYEATAGNLLALSVGASITYARSLKSNVMFEDIKAIEPTIMLVVPLLLEKILLGIYKGINESPVFIKGLFGFLKGTARLVNVVGKNKGNVILFKNIRNKMGLGKIKYLVSGGAALPVWVSKGLSELGFPILQGYGLSETSPVLTFNPSCCPKNETVGLPVPDVEIQIAGKNSSGTGEIIAKGPNVMMGYYKNREATLEVFTPDGFFLTGDIGYFDEDGYLIITGRKKSVIVTRGGKNIFPEEVESVMLQSPYIEEILVLRGFNKDNKKEEVHAIIYPNSEELDNYFNTKHIENPTLDDVRAVIKNELDKYGRHLAEYKRIKRFSLRDEEFPKTTTNKIKRYLFEEQEF